jgi:hypothetical protein
VLTCTREYQKSNDVLSEYSDDRIERGDPEKAFVGLIDIYEDFKDWLRRMNPNFKIQKRKDIQMYFEKLLGKSVRTPKAGWKGYQLKVETLETVEM